MLRMNRSVVALVVCAGSATLALANTQHTTPNIINSGAPAIANLNGTRIINHGLVGVGRIPGFVDAQGSTFGSVSALALDPGSWSYDAATGQYSGGFLTLPDRGRNNPDTGEFVNYQNRIQRFNFTFNPLLNGDGASQNQIQFDYQGLTLLTEANGTPVVGNDPGATVGTAFGRPVPRNNGNMTLDAEGLVALANGDYYISDEYTSGIYRFTASGELAGVINPPDALLPRDGNGDPRFSSIGNPVTGRRANQGMEGLSLSPDGRHLIAMNQSGAMQDSAGSASNRRFTRVLVYDIEQDATPENPIGHYVFELPTFNSTGSGGAVNTTAAQSEIVAISDTQFLVLSRDGNGRGSQNGAPLVYTSIILADITNATNLVDTPFNGTTAVSPGGVLDASITPAEQVEVVNMLNLFDLDRFGLNLDIDAGSPDGDANTLSEKWEGFALVEDIATANPFDYFLFVANDNDFINTDGVIVTSDGSTINYSDSFDHDTMFMAYRISIPAPSSAALLGLAVLGLRRRR